MAAAAGANGDMKGAAAHVCGLDLLCGKQGNIACPRPYSLGLIPRRSLARYSSWVQGRACLATPTRTRKRNYMGIGNHHGKHICFGQACLAYWSTLPHLM
jgi:hypothetical protein